MHAKGGQKVQSKKIRRLHNGEGYSLLSSKRGKKRWRNLVSQGVREELHAPGKASHFPPVGCRAELEVDGETLQKERGSDYIYPCRNEGRGRGGP